LRLVQVLGNVTSVMKQRGMWDHTLFIFSTDNGGPAGRYTRVLGTHMRCKLGTCMRCKLGTRMGCKLGTRIYVFWYSVKAALLSRV
jgi:hypothetical protein